MANSDKNILITPNVGAATGVNPTIRFTGADNTPITLRVLDNGTVSFEGTSGQLFSISDGLSGTIFSVNDISGIPSIEVLDTGLIKLNQYNGQTVIAGSAAVDSSALTVFPRSTTTEGLTVKGLTAQTGDLFTVQNSVNAQFLKVDSSGNVFTGNRLFVGTGSYADAYRLYVTGAVTTEVLSVIRGASSQTGDLLQWQNNTPSVLSRVDAFGRFGIRTAIIGSSSLSVMPDATTSVAQTIRANASQTANIQEWQTSTPTTVTWVDQNAVLNTSNTPTSNNQVANKAYVDNAVTSQAPEIIPLDDISNYFDSVESRFTPLYQGELVSILNPLRLLVTINGIIQYVDFPEYVWMSGIPRRGFFVDSDGYLQFSESVPAGSEFDGRLMSGSTTTTRTRVYPFKPLDILLGG
jgi:hypothetical protein